MKKIFLFCALTAAMISCTKEQSSDAMKEWTFEAPATKASIGGNGAFSWSAGDNIAIWNGTDNAFVTFASASGSGIFSAMAPADAHFSEAAFFPASSALSVSTISLPAAYTAQQLSDGSGIHMYAPVHDGSNKLEFKHMVAYLTIQIPNAAETMDRVIVSSTGGSLSGDFAANQESGINIIAGGSGTITVSFTAEKGQSVSFTIPVPVGNYPVSILAGSETTPGMISMHTDEVSFQRAHIYKLAPAALSQTFQAGCEVYDITVDDSNWE